MPEDDWGAAEPLRGIYDRLVHLSEQMEQQNRPIGNPLKKPDTSWHDKEVQDAYQSMGMNLPKKAAQPAKPQPIAKPLSKKKR